MKFSQKQAWFARIYVCETGNITAFPIRIRAPNGRAAPALYHRLIYNNNIHKKNPTSGILFMYYCTPKLLNSSSA